MFDPYRKWLGIPEQFRPPTHYQLLAISPDEHDREVIEAAVIRQSAYVRNFQKGQNGEFATQILNELAAAKACLLDATKRAAYDASLPRVIAKPAAAVAIPAPPPPPERFSGSDSSAQVPPAGVRQRSASQPTAAPGQPPGPVTSRPARSPQRSPALNLSAQDLGLAPAAKDPLAALWAASEVETAASRRRKASSGFPIPKYALVGAITVAVVLVALLMIPGGSPTPPRQVAVTHKNRPTNANPPTDTPDSNGATTPIDVPTKTIASDKGERPPTRKPRRPPGADPKTVPRGGAKDEMTSDIPPAESLADSIKATAPVESPPGDKTMNPSASLGVPMTEPKAAPPEPRLSNVDSKPKLDIRGLPDDPEQFSFKLAEDEPYGEIRRLIMNGPRMTVCAYSPSGDWLAVGGVNGQVWMWSMKEPKRVELVAAARESLEGDVTCLAFTPDEQTLLVGEKSGPIRCISLADERHREISQFAGHTGEINKILLVNDGARAISCSGGADRAVRVWTVDDGLEISFAKFDFDVTCLQLASDGHHVIASDGVFVAISDTGSPKATVKPVRISQGVPLRVAANPDGRTLLVANGGAMLALEVKGGVRSPPKPFGDDLFGRTGAIDRMEFSADGRILAVVGQTSNAVMIFDFAARKPRQTFDDHTRPPRSLQFSPDGQYLATASLDGTARICRLNPKLFSGEKAKGSSPAGAAQPKSIPKPATSTSTSKMTDDVNAPTEQAAVGAVLQFNRWEFGTDEIGLSNYFVKEGRLWKEFKAGTEVATFAEASRTSLFVELFDPSHQVRVRLAPNSATSSHGGARWEPIGLGRAINSP